MPLITKVLFPKQLEEATQGGTALSSFTWKWLLSREEVVVTAMRLSN